MNTTMNTAVAAEHQHQHQHQHQLIADASSHRRSRKGSHRRTHRVTAFLKDLVAASL